MTQMNTDRQSASLGPSIVGRRVCHTSSHAIRGDPGMPGKSRLLSWNGLTSLRKFSYSSFLSTTHFRSLRYLTASFSNEQRFRLAAIAPGPFDQPLHWNLLKYHRTSAFTVGECKDKAPEPDIACTQASLAWLELTGKIVVMEQRKHTLDADVHNLRAGAIRPSSNRFSGWTCFHASFHNLLVYLTLLLIGSRPYRMPYQHDANKIVMAGRTGFTSFDLPNDTCNSPAICHRMWIQSFPGLYLDI
nr:hypothetical protein CFP56_07696 [Quercus suber]